MLKNFLIKLCKNIPKIKFPWRLKSRLHDSFHCTGDQLCIRKISELSANNCSKTQIIEQIYNKKLSDMSETEIKEATEWLDRVISIINKKNTSFDNVIPSLFPQKYYRGVFEADSGIQGLKKGDIYTDHGFSWFTPKRSYAEDFSNSRDGIIIETVIPAGTKISRDIEASLSDGISGINPFTSMNIVLQNNTKYKVLKTGVKNDKHFVRLQYLGI